MLWHVTTTLIYFSDLVIRKPSPFAPNNSILYWLTRNIKPIRKSQANPDKFPEELDMDEFTYEISRT